MKLFKIAALVALTMLIGASIAYAGSGGGKGDLDRTRDRIHDGTCTTAALQTQTQDQLRTGTMDQLRTRSQDQLRTQAVAQLQTRDQDNLRTQDQLRDCTSPDCPCPDDCLNTQTRTRTGGANG